MAKSGDKNKKAGTDSAKADSWSTGAVRVLVVDADETFAREVADHLDSKGFGVETASDPYHALEKIHDDNYAIALCNITLPGMGGVELLSKIKYYNGMIRVIMLADETTVDNLLSCLRLGADDCVAKPVDDISVISEVVTEAVSRLNRWSGIISRIAVDNAAGRKGDG
ncbi:MAG: response regulator [Planctomycetes bacterium]|nr:response regulator [Planctomycetota bacterium]